MHRIAPLSRVAGVLSLVALAAACQDGPARSDLLTPNLSLSTGSGAFQFQALSSSAACTVDGGDPAAPFVLPTGFTQRIVAREGDGGAGDDFDMNTLNETGPDAGRFLYRPHEVGSNGMVSVTDLETGTTRILAQNPAWGRLDGSVWTPWGTLMVGEERDGGQVWELDPVSGAYVARPAAGLAAHEGLRFDAQGNLYGISEDAPGYIFRLVPGQRGDLSSGQLSALKIVTSTGDRTGVATWVALDRDAVRVDAGAAATAAGATGYARPEDVEIGTATGNEKGSQILYVAVTSEDRVLAIDLREPRGGSTSSSAFVWDYVREGLNAPADFDMPDNLALDKAGNLYVTEDPGGNFGGGKRAGDDIWTATPSTGRLHQPAASVVRFASLTDCSSEPTGIYFNRDGQVLYVNAQHRGGDRIDEAVAISPTR